MSNSQMSYVVITGILMKNIVCAAWAFNATNTMAEKCQHHTKGMHLY